MTEKITKTDFEVLYQIEFLNINSIKSLRGRIGKDEKEVKTKLDKLEKEGLIVHDKNHIEIYSLTNKGKEIFNDNKYKDWKLEFGY